MAVKANIPFPLGTNWLSAGSTQQTLLPGDKKRERNCVGGRKSVREKEVQQDPRTQTLSRPFFFKTAISPAEEQQAINTSTKWFIYFDATFPDTFIFSVYSEQNTI